LRALPTRSRCVPRYRYKPPRFTLAIFDGGFPAKKLYGIS
jgi:hypothetical protein